jgi:hypothetical protein
MTGLLISGILWLLQRQRGFFTGSFMREAIMIKIPPFLGLLIIFSVIYGLFLAISISFFDGHTPLNYRLLSPVYVSFVILTLCLAHRLLHSTKELRFVRVSSLIICLTFLASYLFQGTAWIIDGHNDGLGYTNETWRHSEILEQVRSFPPGTPIYSNGADAIYILTGRPASSLPHEINDGIGRVNKDYLSELTEMRMRLENEDGIVVYFNTIAWRWYAPKEEELVGQLSLRVLVRKVDGTIYKIDGAENKSVAQLSQ